MVAVGDRSIAFELLYIILNKEGDRWPISIDQRNNNNNKISWSHFLLFNLVMNDGKKRGLNHHV